MRRWITGAKRAEDGKIATLESYREISRLFLLFVSFFACSLVSGWTQREEGDGRQIYREGKSMKESQAPDGNLGRGDRRVSGQVGGHVCTVLRRCRAPPRSGLPSCGSVTKEPTEDGNLLGTEGYLILRKSVGSR